MNFKKIFTGLKIATSIVENDGNIDQNTVMTAVFDRRMSEPDSYENSWNSLVLCSKKDFPALNHPKQIHFYSGKNELSGFLYRPPLSRGLILYVHGIGGCTTDWYAIGQNEWLKRGYAVLAIDLTASGYSKGYGIPSLSQSAFDVAEAVRFVKKNLELKNMPLFLFGHSWGGYGVSAAMNFFSKNEVNAVAELSGFASPIQEMLALPEAKLNGISLGDPKPLEDALYARAGENGNLSAIAGIQNSSVPFICVHGDADATVLYQGASILNEAKYFPNVTPLLLKGRDHVNVFLSHEACLKRDAALKAIAEMKKQYGNNFCALNEEQKAIATHLIDRFACSITNQSMFDTIDQFFQSHLN